jgi:hypothetical protein
MQTTRAPVLSSKTRRPKVAPTATKESIPKGKAARATFRPRTKSFRAAICRAQGEGADAHFFHHKNQEDGFEHHHERNQRNTDQGSRCRVNHGKTTVWKKLETQKSVDEMFSSEAQVRLHALLTKLTDVLPSVGDVECDELFGLVASFCENAIEKKKKLNSGKYMDLDVESLMEMAKNVKQETDETIANGKKRSRPDDTGVPRWTFEKAYNIVKVVRVQEQEPFLVFVKARPPVAGNQKPIDYCMGEEDLAVISSQTGKKATRLKNNLVAALEEFYDENAETPRAPLIEKLRSCGTWGKDAADKLTKSTEMK